MWWGLLAGILAMGVLSRVPREFVISVLGASGGWRGVIRAALAGLLLDLCNHGILMVAARLYERGASLGQMMAFLIASPWNSLSLTLVLIALIGWGWTLTIIVLSLLVAILSGWTFEAWVARGILPANPHHTQLPPDFRFWLEARRALSGVSWNANLIGAMLWQGIKDSRMVLRWILFGTVLAALIRALMDPNAFATWFGPSLLGLGLTLLAATVLEVCSEGSAPIAADLFNRAGAPGNGFTFLMAGASTDLTEILVIRETTRSWKCALFLPVVTVPQVLLLGWLLNQAGATT